MFVLLFLLSIPLSNNWRYKDPFTILIIFTCRISPWPFHDGTTSLLVCKKYCSISQTLTQLSTGTYYWLFLLTWVLIITHTSIVLIHWASFFHLCKDTFCLTLKLILTHLSRF